MLAKSTDRRHDQHTKSRIEVIVVGHTGEWVITPWSETKYVDLGPPDPDRHALNQPFKRATGMTPALFRRAETVPMAPRTQIAAMRIPELDRCTASLRH
jgi:hypothetical protein